MARRTMTPARRKRRTIRAALALPVLLLVLVLALDFPILTAGQAMRATQRRYFFGPGEVIAHTDFSRSPNTVRVGLYDRYYILRHGNQYAWCGVNHYGLFWQTGGLDAVENDPEIPLVPLIFGDRRMSGAALVVCNDPAIAAVEVEFPVLTDSGFVLFTADRTQRADNCFLLYWAQDTQVALRFQYPEDLRLRGYDGAGNLIYESPLPESWAEDYNITDPDSWRFRYESLYPGDGEA